MKNKELYGAKIARGGASSLNEQVYNILKREIINGRWSEGERMPSFNDLFASTNLSLYPLNTALRRLEKEGFIERIRKKGIFLKTRRPEGAVLGKIGVVVSGSFGMPNYLLVRTRGFGIWDILYLQGYIQNIGYRTEILTVKSSSDSETSLASSIVPNPDLEGIISFVPQEELNGLSVDEKIPVAFLGLEDDLSSPCVTGDPHRAVFEITRLLFGAGHRRIAVIAYDESDSFFLELMQDGIGRAFKKAGLGKAPAIFQVERKNGSDLVGIKAFFEENKSATAIISLSVTMSQKIVEYADLFDLRIPEDFSLASLQVGNLRGSAVNGITGAYYDWTSIMNACADILFKKKGFDAGKISRIQYRPMIAPGLTVEPPGKGK